MAQQQEGFDSASQVPKVTDWERNLAEIIQQTNRNISYVSKQGSTRHGNHKKFDPKRMPSVSTTDPSRRDSIPSALPVPPPPFFNKEVRQPSSETTVHQPVPTVAISSGSSTDDYVVLEGKRDGVKNFCHQEAREFLLNGGARKRASSIVVSRPFEDDLTKKLSQAVLRSVEKAVTDDRHAVQRRIDRINDQIDHLAEEHRKIYKHYSSLSRTLVSQDRLGKRLKDEWERQRKALKRVDDKLLKDVEWKDDVVLDIKLMKDQLRQQDDASALRVSALEMRNAMNSVTTKTMIAVDKATAISKQSLEAEISSWKRLVEALKQEHDGLRHEIASCRRICSGLESKFDENHVSKVIFEAFHSNLSQLKQDITSNIRASFIDDFSTSLHLEEIISNAVKQIINQKQQRDIIGVQLEKHCRDLKMELINELQDRIEKANVESASRIQITTMQFIDNFLQTKSICSDATNHCELNKQLGDKSSSLQLPPAGGVQHKRIVSQEEEFLLMKEDVEQVKATVERLVQEIKTVPESLAESSAKLEHLNKDLSLIYDAIDTKCSNIQRDCSNRSVAEIQSKCGSMESLVNERLEKITNRLDDLERFASASKQLVSTQDATTIDTKGDLLPSTAAAKMDMTEMMHAISNLKCIGDNIQRLEDETGALRGDLKTAQDNKNDETRLKDDEKGEAYQRSIMDLENKVIQYIQKEQSETERKISQVNGAISSLREELGTMYDRMKENDVTNRNAISSFVDIASCYGKVSSLESKLQQELERVQTNFVDLQKNVVEMNKTSMDRIDFVSQKGWIDDTQQRALSPHVEKRLDGKLKSLEEKVERTKNEMILYLNQAVEHQCARLSDQVLTSSRARHDENKCLDLNSRYCTVAGDHENFFRQDIENLLSRLKYIESKIEHYCITTVDDDIEETMEQQQLKTSTCSSRPFIACPTFKCDKESRSSCFLQDDASKSPSSCCGDCSNSSANYERADSSFLEDKSSQSTEGHETKEASCDDQCQPKEKTMSLMTETKSSHTTASRSTAEYYTPANTLHNARQPERGSCNEEECNQHAELSSSCLKNTNAPLPASFNAVGEMISDQKQNLNDIFVPNAVLPCYTTGETVQEPESTRAEDNRGPVGAVDDVIKNYVFYNEGDDQQSTPLDEAIPGSSISCLLSSSDSTPGSLVEGEYDDIEAISITNISSCRNYEKKQFIRAKRLPSLVYTESGSLLAREQTIGFCDESCHTKVLHRPLDKIHDYLTEELENQVSTRTDSDSLSIDESIKVSLEEEEAYTEVKNDVNASLCDDKALKATDKLKPLDSDEQSAAKSISQRVETSTHESKLSSSFDENDGTSNYYESSFECES